MVLFQSPEKGPNSSGNTNLARCQQLESGGFTRSNINCDQQIQRVAEPGTSLETFDLLQLPAEILMHFFGCLDFKQLWSLRRTCTRLRHSLLSGAAMRANLRTLQLRLDVLCVTGFGRVPDPPAGAHTGGRDAVRVTIGDLGAGTDRCVTLHLDDLWEFGVDFCQCWLPAMRVAQLVIDYEPMPTKPGKTYNAYQVSQHALLNQRSLDLCRHVAQTIDLCAEHLLDLQLLRIEWPWCDKRRWECVQKSVARCDSLRNLRYQCDDVLPPCYTTIFGQGRLARLHTSQPYTQLSISARVRDYDTVHPKGTLQRELADGLLQLPVDNCLTRLQLHTNAFYQAIQRVSSTISSNGPERNPLCNVTDLWLYSDVSLPYKSEFYTALNTVFPRIENLVIRVEDSYESDHLIYAVKHLRGKMEFGETFRNLKEITILDTTSSDDSDFEADAAFAYAEIDQSFANVKKLDEDLYLEFEGKMDNSTKFVPDQYFDLLIGHRGPSYPKDSIQCRSRISCKIPRPFYAFPPLKLRLFFGVFYENHAADGYGTFEDADMEEIDNNTDESGPENDGDVEMVQPDPRV